MAKANSTVAVSLDTLEQIQKQITEAERAFASIMDAATEYHVDSDGSGTVSLFKYAASAGLQEVEAVGNALSRLLPENGGAA